MDSKIYNDSEYSGFNGPIHKGFKHFIQDIAHGYKDLDYDSGIKQLKNDKEWYKNKYYEVKRTNRDISKEIDKITEELEDYEDRCMYAENLINTLGKRIHE